jgi:hypothetical protein
MDLGFDQLVSGVVTQGRAEADAQQAPGLQYVTEFSVQHSIDGVVFTNVSGNYTSGVGDAYYQAVFPVPVRARYVRLIVQAWDNHPSMRAGVILADQETMALTWDWQIAFQPNRLGGGDHVDLAWIQIATWNDWPEGTAVEPHTLEEGAWGQGYGYRALNTTRRKIAEWKAGQTSADGNITQPQTDAEALLVPALIYQARLAADDGGCDDVGAWPGLVDVCAALGPCAAEVDTAGASCRKYCAKLGLECARAGQDGGCGAPVPNTVAACEAGGVAGGAQVCVCARRVDEAVARFLEGDYSAAKQVLDDLQPGGAPLSCSQQCVWEEARLKVRNELRLEDLLTLIEEGL